MEIFGTENLFSAKYPFLHFELVFGVDAFLFYDIIYLYPRWGCVIKLN